MARAVPYAGGMRHPRQPLSRRRSGFTFIEMLVVFVVFAAVMAVSVPAVGDTLRRDRIGKVSAIVSADIEQAFAIAARQREPVRIVVHTAGRNWKYTIQDHKSPATIYKTRSLDNTGVYAVDSLWSNRDTLVIMPNGLATDTLKLSLMVWSRGALYAKSVRASKGGLVRVDQR
jgi:prepilin-type N-terminal cleavage/methylation domain-containing protein